MSKKSERHCSADPVDLQPYEMRAGRCWGLCRNRHLLHLKVHVRIRGSAKNRVYVRFYINTFGLTACRGDGARDTVENTPTIVCGHACGGTDGARYAPND